MLVFEQKSCVIGLFRLALGFAVGVLWSQAVGLSTSALFCFFFPTLPSHSSSIISPLLFGWRAASLHIDTGSDSRTTICDDLGPRWFYAKSYQLSNPV